MAHSRAHAGAPLSTSMPITVSIENVNFQSARRRHFAEKVWFFRSLGAVVRLCGQQSIYLISSEKCSGSGTQGFMPEQLRTSRPTPLHPCSQTAPAGRRRSFRPGRFQWTGGSRGSDTPVPRHSEKRKAPCVLLKGFRSGYHAPQNKKCHNNVAADLAKNDAARKARCFAFFTAMAAPGECIEP